MRRTAILLAALLSAPVAFGAEELVDRVVAVVDGDPILESDIDRVILLGLTEPREGESDRALRRRVLDDLIAQRLRFHEVERYGLQSVPVELVDEHVAAIAARFEDPEELDARLEEGGLTREGLRQLVGRQLEVLVYVEELLGARVFVSLDEIRAYYERELVPELEGAGAEVPPLEEVREDIRAVLRERRTNQELERWTDELRRRADVVDHFDRAERPLPPVRATEPEDGSQPPSSSAASSRGGDESVSSPRLGSKAR